MTSTEPDWITVAQAAVILRRKPRAVIDMCESGRLRAQQPGGPNTQWLVHRRCAERLSNQINP